MRVESYEKQMNRTCRRCYTFFGPKLNYCCRKNETECHADLGLVKRGMLHDRELRKRLYMGGVIDIRAKLLKRKFFRGWMRNECLVKGYRSPWCRSHYCWRWDGYIERNPLDFVDANIRVVSKETFREVCRKEYSHGVRDSYPGGFMVFTDEPAGIRKLLAGVIDEFGWEHFVTEAGDIDPRDNGRPGVEIIMDPDGSLGKPGLLSPLIKNNMFVLVNNKMNMGATGPRHRNVMITTADPDRIAQESVNSLKAFHALKAFRL